jgi:hypothetical protein
MPAYSSSCHKVGKDAQGSTQRQSPSCSQRPFQKLPNEPLTAVSISVDPILVFGDETLLEGPKDQDARRGGPRGAQRRGGQHLLGLGTYHQTPAQAASRDGGVEAKSIPPSVLARRARRSERGCHRTSKGTTTSRFGSTARPSRRPTRARASWRRRSAGRSRAWEGAGRRSKSPH